ncbi:lymphocyte antigen 75-like [Macrobrachium nipponense]|uniref:lymphocyte antigen 75-like n=1 Tax=Macrobrachium nipponense TaxID=159736 RepID=UPI0030C7E5FF
MSTNRPPPIATWRWLHLTSAFVLFLCATLQEDRPGHVMEVYMNFQLPSSLVDWSRIGVEKTCLCKMMCQSLPKCSAVTIQPDSDIFGSFICHFANQSVSEALLLPMENEITLIKPQRRDDVACDDGFFLIENSGCFHIDQTARTWNDASLFCQSRGASLFLPSMPGELHVADEYMEEVGAVDWWVDATGRRWGDDRIIDVEDWYPNKPNGAMTECVVMKRKSAHQYLLDDRNCNDQNWSLCRK